MRFAFADPPYLGCGRLYAAHHPEAHVWDDAQAHYDLIDRLLAEYPDGWAVCLNVPSLRLYLNILDEAGLVGEAGDYRIGSWVKPFASFKPNVPRAYTWEPVIFKGGREISRAEPTWRDHLSEPIALRKGLTGAKPAAFCEWVLDFFNWQPGDVLDDLFPGTGIMGRVIAGRLGTSHEDSPLFAGTA